MNKRFWSWIIFGQALLAMLGSLYYSYFGDPVANLQTGQLFSFANGLSPCELCRWARILMYPIVVISAVGIWEQSTKFVSYVLPLSTIGIFLETYHYLLQKVNISTTFTCTFANPCNALEVNYM
jgi:disulfide bond formation protein DsbB